MQYLQKGLRNANEPVPFYAKIMLSKQTIHRIEGFENFVSDI